MDKNNIKKPALYNYIRIQKGSDVPSENTGLMLMSHLVNKKEFLLLYINERIGQFMPSIPIGVTDFDEISISNYSKIEDLRELLESLDIDSSDID